MKKLVKVRIINWHYFYNTTFTLDQVNFLTGQNAAGKSTLIDAMQVVLLGDTSGRQFNKAASEKAGRTLKGYLKGEIGDDGEGSFKYLRNGRFSSYIVLEWYDDVNDSYFCTGIVFDIFEDSSEEHHFFILQDKIPQNDFCSLNVPMSYKQLNEYFALNYRPTEYWFADTNAQYQEKIKDVFGGIKDKYFSLFKKAVSFTPITNIEQFLTEYVCDVPSEINVESMRNNIQQYKRLEIEADNMKVKISRLEEIHRYYEDFKQKKLELNLASYISKRLTYQVYLNTISNLQNDVASSEARLNEIVKELEQIEDNLSQLRKTKDNLIAQKVSSGAYQLTTELANAKESTERKINEIEDNLITVRANFTSYIVNFGSAAKNIKTLASTIKENRIYNRFKKDIDLLIESSDNMINKSEEFKNVFDSLENMDSNVVLSFQDAITKFKESVLDVSLNIRGELADLISSHNFAKQQVADMRNGGKMYDYQLTRLRSELEHRLSDYYNKQVKVYIYADLVDIKTPKWIKAVEGYLNTQKLSLFVDEEYYETAYRVFKDICKNLNYYRTILVDSEKLRKANIHADGNSLAEEIITDHRGARDYSNYLLGRLAKCETFKEARESGRGVTPDCDLYQGYAGQSIPPKNYQYPLIGRKVSQDVLRTKQLEIDENESLISLLRTLNDTLTSVNKLAQLNPYEVTQASKVFEDAATIPGLKENLARYEEELANSGSIEVSQIENRIIKIDQDIKNLEDDRQALHIERGSLQSNIRMINEEKIPQQIEHSNLVLSEIKDSFDSRFVEEIALPKFNEELQSGRSLVAIRQDYEDLFVRSQNAIRRQFNSLNELRREYCLTYKLSYDITKETNDDFENDLVVLRDVKLPEYQGKIIDAYNKATKEFKDDFIFKLKTSIETVRNQIDDLNEALKDAQFGSDSYQFVVTPAPQYREYYDMITDDLLLSYGADENAYFEKYQEVMSSLFKLIGDVSTSKDQNSVLEQNVVKFTDYRTYLMFDMLVKKGEGKAYSLAKNIKKQSGGETQTPFYVSILASFSQLYRIRQSGTLSNCIRLVIFDEAFSKMDSTRIIESIKILKNFGLQVILSAPSEKVSDLSKIVDKTLLVNRHNSRSFVDPFEIRK